MTLLMLLSLFAAAVVSGLVPVVNAEALLLASVIAAPPAFTLLIVTVVVVGQVVAKIALYRGALGLADSKTAKSSDRARVLVERLRSRPNALRATLFASASLGLPPLYVMTLVAGAARLPLGVFVVLCTTGRFARFYALALVPALL